MTHQVFDSAVLAESRHVVALQLKHSRISADYHTWAFACSVCPLQMDAHLYLWGPPPTSCTALLHPRKKILPASCSTFSRSLTAPCELRVSHLANGFSTASHTQLHQYHHMAEGQRKQVFLEAVEIRFQKKKCGLVFTVNERALVSTLLLLHGSVCTNVCDSRCICTQFPASKAQGFNNSPKQHLLTCEIQNQLLHCKSSTPWSKGVLKHRNTGFPEQSPVNYFLFDSGNCLVWNFVPHMRTSHAGWGHVHVTTAKPVVRKVLVLKREKKKFFHKQWAGVF